MIIVERRIIVAGIRGLVVAHERMPHTLTGERVSVSDIDKWNECDADGEPIYKRLPGDPAFITVCDRNGRSMDVEATLFNWWLWCRPGDLIVCDEIQFIIPRGTLGKSPPHYIKCMEIHRHYGVDFLFITQSQQLLDTTIRNLVGLHRHVRSVMQTSFCVLYEWDHASNTERLVNAAKRPFRRKREWFKLYKSTVAVVSPPRSGRFVLWAVPLLGLTIAVGTYAFVGRFTGRAGATVPVVASAASQSQALAALTRFVPRVVPAGFEDVPKLAGCYSVGEKCTCLDQQSRKVLIALPMCKLSSSSYDGLIRYEPRLAPVSLHQHPAAASSPVQALKASLPL